MASKSLLIQVRLRILLHTIRCSSASPLVDTGCREYVSFNDSPRDHDSCVSWPSLCKQCTVSVTSFRELVNRGTTSLSLFSPYATMILTRRLTQRRRSAPCFLGSSCCPLLPPCKLLATLRHELPTPRSPRWPLARGICAVEPR